MLMIRRSVIGLLFFLGFFVSLSSLAQVNYTSNGVGGWVRNPSTGGCSGTMNHPSQNPIAGTAACFIQIIINHNVTLASLNLDSHTQLIVNTNGNLTVTGNITIASQAVNQKIAVNGGRLRINQNLIISAGVNSTKTNITIETNNGGSIEILDNLNTSKAIEARNNVILNITGDDSGGVKTKSLDLDQKSEINILSGGDLIVTNSVKFSGNNSEINVSGGLVVQGNVEVTGGSGNQLNSYGNSKTFIEEDLIVSGNSDVTFGGTSVTDIGGDIVINGGSKVIARDDAIVYVCGSYPPPCPFNNCQTQEQVNGKFNPGCRILPVDLLHLRAGFDAALKITRIKFATAKEWENSHFEIERSVEAGKNFQKIGTLQGAGWKDSITEYEFEDENLPLSGGDIFYRIRQVDFNGQSSVSKVVGVQIPKTSISTGAWIVYPNPSVMGTTVSLSLIDKSGYAGSKIQISVSDFRGITTTYTVSKPEGVSAVVNSHLENARPGVYIAQIFWENKSEQLKLIKK
jgi:hypothetical protein